MFNSYINLLIQSREMGETKEDVSEATCKACVLKKQQGKCNQHKNQSLSAIAVLRLMPPFEVGSGKYTNGESGSLCVAV